MGVNSSSHIVEIVIGKIGYKILKLPPFGEEWRGVVGEEGGWKDGWANGLAFENIHFDFFPSLLT